MLQRIKTTMAVTAKRPKSVSGFIGNLPLPPAYLDIRETEFSARGVIFKWNK